MKRAKYIVYMLLLAVVSLQAVAAISSGESPLFSFVPADTLKCRIPDLNNRQYSFHTRYGKGKNHEFTCEARAGDRS